jgi:hypothetical protein
LDDVAHGRVQTARCVQLDDEGDVTAALGCLNGIDQMIGDHRGDRIVDLSDEHPSITRTGLGAGRNRERQQRQETKNKRDDGQGPRRRLSNMLQLWRTKGAVTLYWSFPDPIDRNNFVTAGSMHIGAQDDWASGAPSLRAASVWRTKAVLSPNSGMQAASA